MFKKILSIIRLIISINEISVKKERLIDLFNDAISKIDKNKDGEINVYELIKYFIEQIIQDKK